MPVRREAARRAGPRSGLDVRGDVESPPMARLVKLTNKASDNFFAEMLSKDLALQARGRGHHRRAAHGSPPPSPGGSGAGPGSWTARGSRAATGPRPTAWCGCSRAMLRRDEADALLASLPIAGRDGTLVDRMRSGPPRGPLPRKTGTLSDVSALSGFCDARSGDIYAFSILMNGIYPGSARAHPGPDGPGDRRAVTRLARGAVQQGQQAVLVQHLGAQRPAPW